MIVVDASVVTDYLLGRRPAVDALPQTLAVPANDAFHAPDLIEAETLNALRGHVRRGAVSARRATTAVAHLGELRLVHYPLAALRDRIWALRDELSAYDAAYLALAERLPNALLVTADRGLATRARGSLGSERVRLVP